MVPGPQGADVSDSCVVSGWPPATPLILGQAKLVAFEPRPNGDSRSWGQSQGLGPESVATLAICAQTALPSPAA